MTNGKEQSDAQLLELWAQGDRDAGNELFDRVCGYLLRFLAPRAPNVAEDLVQETCQTLVEKREALSVSVSFRAFALGIAYNKLRHHYRRRQRCRENYGCTARSMPDPRTGLSEVVRREQSKTHLARALLELPLDQQMLIEFSFWMHMTSAEIGEILGIPPSTVRCRRQRALRHLQHHLQHL